MLSAADNALLTAVGPETPMGVFMRQFWLPALLEDELPGPDCDPVRLRLLGEDLVAFRDTDNRIGVVAAHCAHRCANLFFGRNEEGGLRCIFHGWKYDVQGNCLDMPTEPDGGARARHEVKIRAYSSVLRGGIVWVYMGPSELKTGPPVFEFVSLPKRQRTAVKRFLECNWAQAVEGGLDSAHISYLHSRTDGQKRSESTRDVALNTWNADRHPVFDIKETRYGMLVGARRDASPDSYYWRITQFLLPFYTMVPPRTDSKDSVGAFYWGHAFVPIDDHHCWAWSLSANPWREYTDQEIEWGGGRNGFWGPLDEHYHPLRNKANDYLINRRLQRTASYSGIEGFGDQDACVQESMGPISNRTREYLGQSDRAIVAFRRQVLELVKQKHGPQSDLPKRGDWYNVRSASVILDRAQPFDVGAAWLLDPKQSP
jgi:nitrite reductase/ring-hydroxylating ferredoxin subunit